MPFAFSGAVIITPKPTAEVHVDSGAILGDTTTKLNWTPIANATDYVIEVATSRTALNQQPDIARHCAQNETSALVKHLPLNGTNVYIRIWAKVNGEWQYQDYKLGTKPRTNKKSQVTRTYFITDHLGTPRFGYNDKKIQTWRWASDGFGNQAPNSDVDGDGKQVHFNFRMPGQYYDAESGLFYNWNRYYDAGIGRYVTSDPIGLAGGLNTFGYVYGNPLSYIDPWGLEGMFLGPSACKYYDDQCDESCGEDTYACKAKKCCESFGDGFLSNCTRKCLIDSDKKCATLSGKARDDCRKKAHYWCYAACGNVTDAVGGGFGFFPPKECKGASDAIGGMW